MSKELTRQEKRALLVSIVIGKANLEKSKISIIHCKSQSELLIYKKELLELIFNCKPIIIKKKRVIEKKHRYFKSLRKWIYKNNKKTISRKILNMLNRQAIAIWYMDSGSLSPKKKNNKICAYQLRLNTYLTKEESQIIIDYFKEVWDFRFGLNKSKGSYVLRMGTKEARRFSNFIRPYVIPCMEYKLLGELECS